MDECTDELNNCSVNATCTDLVEGFTCTCNEGYVGDGVSCSLAPCPTNASGGPFCRCNEDYEGELNFDVETSQWVGECTEIDPCQGIICRVGEVCDPDTSTCVDCSRSFECVNGAYCESGDEPACWAGDEPVCYDPRHELSQQNCDPARVCSCPRGYTPTPNADACVQTINVPATNNATQYDVCDANGNTAYGWAGALYEDTDGDSNNNAVRTPYFESRLNTVGIWACNADTAQVGTLPVNEWIGFSHCIDIRVGGDYLIGIAGDNRVRFRVDGEFVFELDTGLTFNFNFWHIRKVSLTSGVHVIELLGRNDGSAAAFGAEISGPFSEGTLSTEAQQQNADYAGNIIFSTENMVGDLFDVGENSGWSCPDGAQTLNTCVEAPICTSIEYVDCIER